jgi:hypothetical protein
MNLRPSQSRYDHLAANICLHIEIGLIHGMRNMIKCFYLCPLHSYLSSYVIQLCRLKHHDASLLVFEQRFHHFQKSVVFRDYSHHTIYLNAIYISVSVSKKFPHPHHLSTYRISIFAEHKFIIILPISCLTQANSKF